MSGGFLNLGLSLELIFRGLFIAGREVACRGQIPFMLRCKGLGHCETELCAVLGLVIELIAQVRVRERILLSGAMGGGFEIGSHFRRLFAFSLHSRGDYK